MMLRRPAGIMGNRELTDVFPRLRKLVQPEKEVTGYAPASD
jgi:hypothetical protein